MRIDHKKMAAGMFYAGAYKGALSSRRGADPMKLVPFQQENLATNQQNVPLPYVRGTRLVAGRWISGAINMVSHDVPATAKKG